MAGWRPGPARASCSTGLPRAAAAPAARAAAVAAAADEAVVHHLLPLARLPPLASRSVRSSSSLAALSPSRSHFADLPATVYGSSCCSTGPWLCPA
eukprot:9475137-Pyramimonas_sp.AAC.1